MIIDNALKLSDLQDVRATASSTNVIDLSVARDIGDGTPLYIVFNVNTTITTLTSLEMQVRVSDTVTNAGALNNDIVVIGSTGAIPVASLVADRYFVLRVPIQINVIGKRYMDIRYVVTGANAVAGNISANFVIDYQEGSKIYPANHY